MKRSNKLAWCFSGVALLVVTFAGCHSLRGSQKPGSTGADSTADSASGSATSGAASTGSSADSTAPVAGVSAPTSAAAGPGPSGGLLDQRIVYFDFDMSELRADARDVVTAHGRYLASNPGTRVRLEGHTDERGTREYNIALGERRAQSVRALLMLQGVAAGQIDLVSFGEERPAVSGDSDEAMAQNRRVELVYAK